MAEDKFSGQIGNLDSPAMHAAEVTPDDDTDLPSVSRGLYVGGIGDVTVRMSGDGSSEVTFTAVPAGTILPIRVARVMLTGTDATNIVALW